MTDNKRDDRILTQRELIAELMGMIGNMQETQRHLVDCMTMTNKRVDTLHARLDEMDFQLKGTPLNDVEGLPTMTVNLSTMREFLDTHSHGRTQTLSRKARQRDDS
jgi:hypothetical protein